MLQLLHKKDTENQQNPSELRIFIPVIAVLSVIFIVFVILNIHTLKSSVTAGAASGADAFQKTKEHTSEQTYQLYYQTAFDNAERYYHVSNEVTINIDDVREVAKLEVLQLSVTEYAIEEKTENKERITSWLEVPVTGVYTVNLQAGEYLVDRARRTVLIRLPAPVLEHVDIDDENVRLLLFKNDMWNDSAAKGEELHKKQRLEAFEKAYDTMQSNPAYIERAENSAKTLITNLVKKINIDVEGLVVEVEFMD